MHSPIRAREGEAAVKMCIGMIIGILEIGLTLIIDYIVESAACKLIMIIILVVTYYSIYYD